MGAACNICGGNQFAPGPKGRLTQSGAPPRCAGCRSLERQRALRECLDRLPREMFSWRRALQFAPDGSLDPAWFRSYEASQYEGENSLDLQAIDRPADSYDFISLSSVLEFVPDDQRAFKELIRIASPNCLIHCTFTPVAQISRHSSEPYGAFGRYHLYGHDLNEWFDTASHGLTTLTSAAVDPVTGDMGEIHFFSRRDDDTAVIRTSLEAGTPRFEVTVQAPES